MNAQMQAHRDYGFVIGLLTGSVVGAGLAMWLTSRSGSKLRERITDSARRLGEQASDQYEQASTRVAEAVDELTRKGQEIRDDLAGAVERGAREVEHRAKSARTR